MFYYLNILYLNYDVVASINKYLVISFDFSSEFKQSFYSWLTVLIGI